jgi:hypothetical protein
MALTMDGWLSFMSPQPTNWSSGIWDLLNALVIQPIILCYAHVS